VTRLGWLSRRARGAIAAGLVLGIGLGLAGCGSSVTPTTTSPTATGSASTTAPTTTAPAVLLPGTGRPTVALGDMNTPEQFVLGRMYDLALAAQGFTITLSQNIGPTSVSLGALQQGSLDLFPEYLNVWDGQVAGVPGPFSSLSVAYAAGETYATEHGMELLNATPFGDTEGIAVTTAFALANHLRTLADLQRVAATMVLGAPIPFVQSPTGLPAVEQAYGFQPARTLPVNIGSQYAELRSGQIQAAYVSTTDPQLSTPAFKLLRDPQHILGFGNVVPVTTQAVIAAEGPSFAATVNQISALLSLRVIRELNAEVNVAGQTPTIVAQTFLQQHGVLPATASTST
jgi:osmoprotectant transport system substrate-binding protein